MNDNMHRSSERRFMSRKVLAITLALVAGAAVFPLGNSGVGAAVPCRSWAFIGIPGSGQGRAHNPGLSSDTALYGPEVAKVKQAFVAKRGATNVAVYPINYTAYNVAPNLLFGVAANLVAYNASVSRGVTETKRIISNVAAACPGTRFVISGYSQGAQVATNTLGSFPIASSKLYRVGLMGNPRFSDGSVNSVEVPAGSIGRHGVFNGGATWLSTWNGKVRDVCIDRDTFCEAGSAFNFDAHGAYNTRAYPGSITVISTYLGRTWLGG